MPEDLPTPQKSLKQIEKENKRQWYSLQYFCEELICFGAIVLYFVMFCITTIVGIIAFEKNIWKYEKEQKESAL